MVLANHCYGVQLPYPLTSHKETCKSCFFFSCPSYFSLYVYSYILFDVMYAEHEKSKILLDFSCHSISFSYSFHNSGCSFQIKTSWSSNCKRSRFSDTDMCFFFMYIWFSELTFFLQIGHLPKGLNPPSSNMLYFQGPFLGIAIKTGIVTGILSLTVSYL